MIPKFLQPFFTNPKPTFTSVDAANPALPLPHYQITGTPQPVPIPARPDMFNKAMVNPFPPSSIVQQPPRLTVIA